MLQGLILALLVTNGYTYDPGATRQQICTPGYTHAERIKDTYELRDRVYNAYGLPRGHRQGYVIDHFIPLELGGRTVEENLWPQRREESYRKDRDENRLHADVCAGRIAPSQARDEMLRLWGRAFLKP